MKKINKKILIITISIILAVVAVSTATYSLFVNEQSADNPTSYTTGILSITATSKTNNLNLTNAIPMSDEDGVLSEPYTFTITNTGNVDYKFNVKLLSTGSNTFSSDYIKLKVDDSDIITLSNCTNSIIKQDVILKAGQSIDITIHIWLSNDTPNTELGKTFTSQIVTDGQAIILPPPATKKITNLYTNAPKTPVTNNTITYNYANIYDTDSDNTTSGGLMDDKMIDEAGNIRYYGKNPNNYIYFNCSDYSNQSADICELWRIIGVFKDIELADGTKKDLVKIIRNDSIGNLAWDQDKNIDSSLTTYDNDWSTSSLQLLLNNQYYEGKETVTYYSRSNGKISTTLDMASIGLKNDNTRNKIAEVTWNLGGWNTSKVYSDEIYGYERGTTVYSGRPTIWTGKIGLMYPSDYGYAAGSKCTQNLYNYNNAYCYAEDWLHTGDSGWFLTPTVYSNKAYFSNLSLKYDEFNANMDFNVRPTLFLTSDQFIEFGTGSSTNPYQLGA